MLELYSHWSTVAQYSFTWTIHKQQIFLMPFVLRPEYVNQMLHPPTSYSFSKVIPVFLWETVSITFEPDVAHHCTGTVVKLL